MNHPTIKVPTKVKINNAITWITVLPEYDQVRNGNLMITHEEYKKRGYRHSEPVCEDSTKLYCCLGVGNEIMGVPQSYDDLTSGLGLLGNTGEGHDFTIKNPKSRVAPVLTNLATVNDSYADFEEIQDILMSHPENFFEPEVAEGIRKHFESN